MPELSTYYLCLTILSKIFHVLRVSSSNLFVPSLCFTPSSKISSRLHLSSHAVSSVFRCATQFQLIRSVRLLQKANQPSGKLSLYIKATVVSFLTSTRSCIAKSDPKSAWLGEAAAHGEQHTTCFYSILSHYQSGTIIRR